MADKKIDRKKGKNLNNVNKSDKKVQNKKKTKLSKTGKAVLAISLLLGAQGANKLKNAVFSDKTENIYEENFDLGKYKKYEEVLNKTGAERTKEDDKLYEEMKFELEQEIGYTTLKAGLKNEIEKSLKENGADNAEISLGGIGENSFITVEKNGTTELYEKHDRLFDGDKVSKPLPNELDNALKIMKKLDNIAYKINHTENIDFSGEELKNYLKILQNGEEVYEQMQNKDISIDDNFNMKIQESKDKGEKLSKVVEGKTATVEFKEGYKVNVKPISTEKYKSADNSQQTQEKDDIEIG